MSNPYREPEARPRCEGRWRTRDNRWAYCRFDAEHVGPCADNYSRLPDALLEDAFKFNER